MLVSSCVHECLRKNVNLFFFQRYCNIFVTEMQYISFPTLLSNFYFIFYLFFILPDKSV